MKLHRVKLISRTALALVWLYEGIVPKLLFADASQLDLVQPSGLAWDSPPTTLRLLGFAQAAMGLWLLSGMGERTAVAIATVWMCVLIVLVACGNPWMLTDPYGALVKDACLIACAWTVWVLSEEREVPV